MQAHDSEVIKHNSTPEEFELTILMPCLNECETIEACLTKASKFLSNLGAPGEILIADNGSTDGSQEIAKRNGARVVNVPTRGYGAALMTGINNAKGKFVIMGDADDSYDFSSLMFFVEKLRNGYDLVMGNRFMGGIEPNAMPFLHRYLGNPVLTFIGRLFFGSKCRDFHCGLRGFNRDKIMCLGLQTTGMEFASEMVVKATLQKLKITEVPTTLSKDGRSRAPHLRTWHDGWRHLRFLLLYSPRWLFLYPGLFLLSLGLIGMSLLLPGPLLIAGIAFDVHTLAISATSVILGVQVILFWLLAQQFAINHGLLPNHKVLEKLLRNATLERVLILGMILVFAGIYGIIHGVASWREAHFGILDYQSTMRIVIPSTTAITVGLQIAFSAFFSSILNLALKNNRG